MCSQYSSSLSCTINCSLKDTIDILATQIGAVASDVYCILVANEIQSDDNWNKIYIVILNV